MACVSLLLSNDVGSEQVISYQRRKGYTNGKNDDSKNMYGFKQLKENTNSQTITLEQWI